jgi:hypothetical protein
VHHKTFFTQNIAVVLGLGQRSVIWLAVADNYDLTVG